MKSLRPFAVLAAALLAFTPPVLLAAPGDLDATFLTGIGAGLTPSGYPTFDTGTGATNAVALQSTGKIIAGGNISRFNNTGDLIALKRLNADGSLDATFNIGGAGLATTTGQPEINAIVVAPDDKIYVGGTFNTYNGQTRASFARLNADGSLDTTFTFPSLGGSTRYVHGIALQPDGKVLIAGAFTSVNGTGRTNLARLNADGSLDTSFTPSGYTTQGGLRGLQVASDGKIYVGGTTYNAAVQRNDPILHRLNPDGTRDFTFNPIFAADYGAVNSLLLLPDGRILAGSDLPLPGYPSPTGLAAFHPDGSVDHAFMTKIAGEANGGALTLHLSPDGNILMGGIFTRFGGLPRASIVRLAPDGTIDPAFAPQPYGDRDTGYLTHLYAIAVQPDGRIVAGGWFNRISDPNLPIYSLVRFQGDYTAGPGRIGLTSSTYTFNENAGTVTVAIARFGGITGAVSVDYALTAGTATATDLALTSGTLSWANNEGGVKTFTVALTNDALAESLETAVLTLSNPTGGATLGTSLGAVAIRDDDSIPALLLHPVGGNVDQGDSFAFAIAFDSVLAATVQWQLDSGSGFANIPGATGVTYTISVADLAVHTGSYRVVITNANGSATSNAAALVVKIPAGSLVASFNPGSGALSQVISAGLDPAGNILAGGANGLIRLTSGGVIDPSFTTAAGAAVNTVVPLPDGSSLIGGAFTTINGTAQNYFAHINVNGTLDSTVNFGLTQAVNILSLGANNKLYLGHAGSQGLKRYTLTGATGTLDSTLVTTGLITGTGGSVINVKERADGKIFLSSQSGTNGFGFTYQFRLLTNTGALDPAFTPPTLSWLVHDWEILPDGRIVIVGRFVTINGVSSKGIAVLKPDGSLDTSFNFANAFTGPVTGIRYVNGRFLVWGSFTAFAGTPLNGIARLNPDGTLDPTFKVVSGANSGAAVNTVVVLPDQRLFLGGNFTSMRGVARTRTALLEAGPSTLGVAPSAFAVTEGAGSVIVTVKRFAPAAGAVSVAYTTTDGSATTPGDYTAASGTLSWSANDTTDRTVTIPLTNDSTGESAESFTFNLSAGSITGEANLFAATATIAITDDDNPPFIVTPPQAQTVGQGTTATFTVVATSTPAATYRWTFNGTDLSDGAGISGSATATLTIANAGPTHIGAYRVRLTNSNGPTSSAPAQLSVTLNPAFTDHTWPTNLTVNGRISVILPLPDGGAYVGGRFTNFNGQTGRSYLVKINAAGVVDSTFSPAPNGGVLDLRLVGNVLYVLADFASPFSTIGGDVAVSGFAALDATTGARLTPFMTALGTGATSFTSIRALAVAPDGDVILGGDFPSFNNNFNHHYLARLNPDGTLDAVWNTSQAAPVSGSALVVTAVEVGADGKIIAGGTISHQGGSRLIRFNADGTRDGTFAPAVNASSTTVTRIKILADGRVFATGSNLPGSRTIVRLSATGEWTFGDYAGTTSGTFSDVAVQRNGRAIGVGSFSFVRQPSGSGNFSNIARFDPVGTLEQTWPTGVAFDTAAYTVALAEDGKIWVGGDFTTYNGIAAQRLIRLNGDAIPLGITLQPKSVNVNPGDTVLLKARATGTSAITYEWRKAGTPLANGGRISGADTAELTITGAIEADEGAYTLRVTNASGEEISSVAQLVVLGAPEILTEPTASGIAFGNRAYALTVTARGVGPLTYQWRKGSTPLTEGANGITGTNTDRLVFATLADTDAGDYTVVITNGTGSATSATFTIAVTAHPLDRHPTFTSVAGTNPTTLYSILPLPDGGALLGGSFNSIQGASSTASAGRLARVLPNGQVAAMPFVLNGNVRSMAFQPDGKILIGGEFTTLTPTGQSAVTRNRLARLNADYTFDASFDPGAGPASQVVSAIVVDALGRIYAGGSFATWGGTATSNYLVRLRPDGSIDPTFNTPFNNYVYDLELDASGRLYVAGQFTNYQGGSQLVRLNADGSRDTTFAITLYATVFDLALQPDGKVLAVFQSSGLRRLTDAGALDATFPALTVNSVSSVALQADGQIVLTGGFTTYDGYARNGLVRLSPTGVVDPVLAPAGVSNGLVRVDGYGRLWFGGAFTVFNNTIIRGIYVMNGDAVPLGFARAPLAQSVEPGQTATFTAFTTGTSTLSYRWLRNGSELSNGGNISGATTATLTIANTQVTDEASYALRITNTAGTKTSSAAELVVLGTPEVVFPPVAANREVGQSASFFVQARGAGTLTYQWLKNGTALVNGGVFSGVTTPALTLNPLALTDAGNYSLRITGSAGTTTTTPVNLTVTLNPAGIHTALALPKFNTTVSALAPNDDGTFFVGGSFTQITPPGASATTRNRFAKIKADGTIDVAWPTFNAQVYAIAKDSTGRVYVGGSFTTVTPNGGSAVTRNRLVRLNADGSLDLTFNAPGGVAAAGPNNQVKGIKFDATGRVYIHGDFATYNGTTVNYLARLNADGSLDTGFTSATNYFVYDLEFNSDGRLWISHGGTWSGQNYLLLASDAGVRDAGFTYAGSLTPNAMALTSTGSVINVSNSWPYLQKIGLTGAVATESFLAVNNSVSQIVGNGTQFYLWGPSVTTYGTNAVPNLFRLNADGTHDAAFTPSSGTGVGSGTVETMVIDSQGRLWVGGSFGSYNGDTAYANFFVLNGGAPQTNSGPPADPFADFVAGLPEGQRGAGDDADGDGASNLLEYALGLNPAVVDPDGLPLVTIVSNRLTFAYARARADVTYSVETSTDLINWTITGVDQGTPAGDGVTIASVAMDVPNRFLRLKVER